MVEVILLGGRFGVNPFDQPAVEEVKIETRRGKVEVKVRLDRNVPNNVIFFPFAFREAPANMLTNPKLDPIGKIPEFKYCAS